MHIQNNGRLREKTPNDLKKAVRRILVEFDTWTNLYIEANSLKEHSQGRASLAMLTYWVRALSGRNTVR
jgi:hypothetical protein